MDRNYKVEDINNDKFGESKELNLKKKIDDLPQLSNSSTSTDTEADYIVSKPLVVKRFKLYKSEKK